MSELTGKQKRQFDEAFLSAFSSYEQLKRMLDYEDIDLNSFSNPLKSMPEVVADLRTYALSHNKLNEIIEAALAEVPGNRLLQQLKARLFKDIKTEISGNDGVYIENVSPTKESITKQPKEKPQKDSYKIFISYSSRDRELREFFEHELKSYLMSSKYKFDPVWTDTEITMGDDWNNVIQTALANSDIGILLVSQRLLSSKYSIEDEFSKMLNQRAQQGYLIVPVLLRETNFGSKPELAAMQFFKTYQSEYDVTHPIKRNRLMPFDELYEKNSDRLFNRYFNKFVHELDKALDKRQQE